MDSCKYLWGVWRLCLGAAGNRHIPACNIAVVPRAGFVNVWPSLMYTEKRWISTDWVRMASSKQEVKFNGQEHMQGVLNFNAYPWNGISNCLWSHKKWWKDLSPGHGEECSTALHFEEPHLVLGSASFFYSFQQQEVKEEISCKASITVCCTNTCCVLNIVPAWKFDIWK
jgi:hypothetical protein